MPDQAAQQDEKICPRLLAGLVLLNKRRHLEAPLKTVIPVQYSGQSGKIILIDIGIHRAYDHGFILRHILDIVGEIETLSPQTLENYKARLRAKIEELLGDASVDEQRLLTETAIFADKIAVDEETVRLRSHFSQMDKMLHSGEAVGRKLDFIVQEMNREANTIGSKCQNSDVAHLVVEIKAEIEKIREQIQNIE